MKKTVKKVLLAALAVAVLIPCFSALAFAETGSATGIADVLEYYDPERTYQYAAFDDPTDGGVIVTKQSITYDGGFATIELGKSSVMISEEGAEGNVGFNVVFKVSGTDAGYAVIELGNGYAECLRVVFDFSAGKVSCSFEDPDAATPAAATELSLTLQNGVLYSVSLYFDEAAGTVALSVSDGDNDYAVEGGIAVPDLKEVTRAALTFPVHPKNKNAVLSLDSVEIYNGSFMRNAADKQSVSEEAVLTLVDLYNAADTSDADKETLIRTIRKLLDYGFTTDRTDVNEAVAGGASMEGKECFNSFSSTFYTNELVKAVTDIDTEGDFSARADVVREMTAIYEAIKKAGIEDPAEGTDSDYARALAAYRTEKATVEELEAGSKLLIATFRDVVAAKLNYAQLSALLDTVENVKIDPTYPDITSSLKAYDQVAALKIAMDGQAASFLLGVSTLSETDADFAARYLGYVAAADALFEDTTFFLTVDGEKTYPIEVALATYNEQKPYFDKIVTDSEAFLSAVIRAVSANDIASRMACILEAEALLTNEEAPVERGYLRAGTVSEEADYSNSVAAAIAKIAAMNEELEQTYAAVERYVELAATLKDATTMAQKKTILASLEDLRVSDDFLVLDGVLEANCLYSNAAAEYDLWFGYSERLLAAMSDLANATTLSDRAGCIGKANGALAKLTDKTYEGVTAAETALAEAIKAYNRDVVRANELFERANDTALDASQSAAPKTIVGIVAWITKEQYKKMH